MNIEIPIIQLAEPSNASSLAKIAEKTFRDAFAQLNNKKDFESYVARSFTENRIRSELLDSASTTQEDYIFARPIRQLQYAAKPMPFVDYTITNIHFGLA